MNKPKNYLKITGISLLLIGAFFVINAFSGVTGFVISEALSEEISSIMAPIIILIGVLLVIAGQHYEI